VPSEPPQDLLDGVRSSVVHTLKKDGYVIKPYSDLSVPVDGVTDAHGLPDADECDTG
jgi:hypothetical protein